MLKIETQTSHFQSSHPMLPESFALLPDGTISKFRNHHLVEHVIVPLVAKRNHVQYHGELEAFILEPLLQQALTVLDASRYKDLAPGFFLQYAQKYATAYALAAEALTVSQTKSMFDAVSAKIMDISPIIQAINQRAKDMQKPDTAGKPIPGNYDVIGGLNSIFKSGNIYDTVYQTVSTAEVALVAQDFASQLILLGGTGPGLPLPISVLPARSATLMQITQAIKILLDPSLASTSKTQPSTQKFQQDAYAMAVMFAMYLHHSQNEETYSIAFSGQPATADAKTRMPMAIQSARRLAWMYSGVATAPQSFDYLTVQMLIQSVLQFVKPAQISQASRLMDIEADLALADDILARSIPAPIQAHFGWTVSALKRLTNNKILLPEAFFDAMLPNKPSIPSVLNPEKGWSAIEWDTYTTNQVSTSVLQNISLALSSMTYQLRVSSQSLSTRVNSFLLHNQFDPNTLNVPSSLFADDALLASISSLDKTTYLNPWKPDEYSMPIKRFLPDPKAGENFMKWVAQDITYAPTCLPRLRLNMLMKDAITFKPVAAVPVKRSVGELFALSAVPRSYVSHSIVGEIKNDFKSVAQAIKANAKGLNGAYSYFQDAAAICAFGDDDQRSSMAWALSGMFTVYVLPDIPVVDVKLNELKPAASLQLSKLSFPLPYIYGYPTSTFLARQSYTASRSHIVSVQGPKGKTATVVFCLHSHTVPVSAYSFYQVPVTYGVLATVPIANKYSVAISEALAAATADIVSDDAEQARNTLDMYKKIQISESLKVNSGESIVMTPISEWAATLAEYPHVAFSHFSTLPDILGLSEEDTVSWAYADLKRTVIPGSSEMLVRSTISDAYVMFEAKDAYNQDLIFDVAAEKISDIITAQSVEGQKPATTSGKQTNAGVAASSVTTDADAAQADSPKAVGSVAASEQMFLSPLATAPDKTVTHKITQAKVVDIADPNSLRSEGPMIGQPDDDLQSEIAAIQESDLTEAEKAEAIAALKARKVKADKSTPNAQGSVDDLI